MITGRRVQSLACQRSIWPSSRRSWKLAPIARSTARRWRWRRIDLKRVIAERFGVDFHPRYVGKLLRKLGFSHINPRGPRHPGCRTSGSSSDLKKLRARAEGSSGRRRRDDAGGNMVPRRGPDWPEERSCSPMGQARERGQGSPPINATTTPICSRRDLPSAGCSERDALALPYADTDMTCSFTSMKSRTGNVAAGAHAVLLLDRAGWHTTCKLDMPANITPIFLPSRAPELNPVENVWQYLTPELALKHRLRKLRRHRRRRLQRQVAKAHRRARQKSSIHRNARMGPHRSAVMTFGIKTNKVSN